ncbi:ylp motif-containing protein 1 [Plakobranchus ocellatus]|uniref:YLP motif-containing protein 1 n=1 Tax=Plakobranchus ocellatus TaxID=259542 RepID=A0AAV4BE09_9GAST|nr:ylp motif-containing protein 1 [Plakobranchus ocellatus]
MYNWNAPLRGHGFPVQNPPVQMMGYGAPGQMGLNPATMQTFQQPQWGQQQQSFPPGIGMLPLMAQPPPPQWQQQHPMPPQQFPQQQPRMFPLGMMGGIHPVPPSLPPLEEKPPLPSEPPPPLPSTPHEKPPLPSEQPKPPLPKEDTGTHDSPRPPDEPVPLKPAPPSHPPAPDPAIVAELEKVKKEEQVFLDQYKQWKQQYDDWREQNQNHPNKEQYEQYLSQWKTYEGQMESRRQSIADQKAALEEKVGGHHQAGAIRSSQPREEQSGLHARASAERNSINSGRDVSYSGGRGNRLSPEKSNQWERQQQPAVEGDDMGEEDMNLDDDEESGAGGIIESSSHVWPSGPHNPQILSQPPPQHRENEPHVLPDKSKPFYPREENSFDESSSKDTRFEDSSQVWEPSVQRDSGPGGFYRGRGRGEWSNNRGMMGQGPKFGWRGGENPRYQAPALNSNKSSFAENEEDLQKPSGYRDNNPEDRATDGNYADEDFQQYDNTDLESFNSFSSYRGRGGSGTIQRGRGGPDAFQRGRGGPDAFQRGRGGPDAFQRGRGGPDAFQRGRGGPDAFQRGRGGPDAFQRGRGGPDAFQRGRGGPDAFQRGRGGPDAFQRGRGSEIQSSRGRGFERGRGVAYGRGNPVFDEQEDFPRAAGEESYEGRSGRYGEETAESDFFTRDNEQTLSNRGRGSWPNRGRGGFQGQPSSQFGGNIQDTFTNYDEEGENNFDDVERQAEEQYADDEELEGSKTVDNFQFGFRGRGRGAMLRGRGRGGFTTSFGNSLEDAQFESQDYYEDQRDDFVDRGQERFQGLDFPGVGRGEPFRGRGRGGMDMEGKEMISRVGNRGRGELNLTGGRMGRGRGALRGRGGHGVDFQRGENTAAEYYDDGVDYSNDEIQDQNEVYHPRGRGRGTARSGFGRGAYAAEDSDQFASHDEPSQWDHFQPNVEKGWGGARGRGRGRGTAMSQQFESRWNEGAFENEREAAQGALEYENKRTNSMVNQEPGRDDEPLAKRGRFDTDERNPYDAPMDRFPPHQPRDHFDPYGDRYLDPYGRYPDPYLRDPYYDPYAPLPFERGTEYERFGKIFDRKPFTPAESIDYGHGELDKEKKKAAIQPKEVIDYGHGRAKKVWSDLGRDNTQREDRLNDFTRDDPYGHTGRYDHMRQSGQESDAKSEHSGLYSARFSSPIRKDADSSELASMQRHQQDFTASRSRGLEGPQGDRGALPDDLDKDPYNRNRDDVYKRNDDDIKDRAYNATHGRDSINPYHNKGRDDRFGERELRGRDGDELYDRSRDSSYGRDRDDRYKERDMLHSRERDLEESPRRRRQDDEGRYGSSSRRNEMYRKEESPQSRDYMRRDDYNSGSRRDHSDDVMLRGRRNKDGRGEIFPVSQSQDSLRNADSMKRWDDKDFYGMTSSRDQIYSALPGARDLYGERAVSSPSRNSTSVRATSSSALPVAEIKKVEDLLCLPGRDSRPPQLVVIIRGLPGSGKTYVSKLLREKEIKFGGSAPRMLCLDDYFMVEVDKQEVDPDTGKKVKKKVLEYEYEQALENAYRQSLLKSFKKTVDDGFFPFIIVDATNEKVVHFSEFWSYAKSRGFQVYVGELNVDVATCIQRNIHQWTEWDIQKVKSNWEPLPNHYIRLDLRWLLQDDSIAEVEMEDTDPNEAEQEEKVSQEEDEEEEEQESGFEGIYKKSKWELDTSEKTLDKLDGIPVSKKHIAEHQSLKDYLQLDEPEQLDDDDDYYSRESLPGKKRVRWADLEEKKTQNRRRDLGFIVGQTKRDWERITDDDFATKALNQTKYFYKN